jgi:hypothetical protein
MCEPPGFRRSDPLWPSPQVMTRTLAFWKS